MIFRSVGNGDICDKEGGVGIFSHVDHRQTTGAKVAVCVCVCVVSTEPTTTTTSLTEEAESSSEKMGDGSPGAQGDARNNIYDNGLFLLTLKWVSARWECKRGDSGGVCEC